jgi:hypothetical protein
MNSSVTIPIDGTLQQQLAAATVQPTVSDMIAIMTNGLYGIDRYQSNYINNQPVYSVRYGKTFYTSSNSRINHNEFKLINNSWQPDTDSDQMYLTSTGWQVEAGDYGTWDQATNTYTSSGGGQRMKASLVKYDVTGQPFAAYLSEWQGTTPTGSFPAGSEAYRLTFTYLADTYRLSTGWNICTQHDQNGTCLAPVTTLAGLISNFSNTVQEQYGGYLGVDNIGLRLGALNSSTNSGILSLYSRNADNGQLSPLASSTYQIKTVNGVQLLVADARPAGEGYIIFAVYNGRVQGGEFYPGNVARLSSDVDLNKTAVNAIAMAAGFPAIP